MKNEHISREKWNELKEKLTELKKKAGRLSRKQRFLGGAVILILFLAVFVWAGNRGLKVETAGAVREAVEDYYTQEGTITFGSEYQVSAQVSGPVAQILVEENDRVEAGDVLFLIDSQDYEYEKELAQSELDGYEAQLELSRINQLMTASPQEYLNAAAQTAAAAEAEYETAKSVYEADQVLYGAGDISRLQYETDKAAYEAALAAWQQASGRYEESRQLLEQLKSEGIDETTVNSRFYSSEEAQLTALISAAKTRVSQLETQLERCRVKTEKDGIVTSLPVKEMSVVQAGAVAAVIGSREKPMVQADVLTNIAPYIKAGDPVEVTLQLKGRDQFFSGTVDQVYDYAARGVSSLGLEEYRVHVTAALEAAQELETREGYGVTVKFLLYQEEDCLTVPSDAVFTADGLSYVYLIRGGRARKTPVETEYETGTRMVLRSGLEEGDQVIRHVDGEGLYDGAKVRK